MQNRIMELKTFLILWSTQSLSQLGSAMTNFALTLWLYERTGSALQTALLSICSYAPYVCMSIFAGALSDRWDKKKVMLGCDAFAACCTVAVLVLLKYDLLVPGHMYVLNAVNGLMNTIQQPAGDVAMTLLVPKEHYQKTSGLRSLSNSLVTILNPVFATALYAAGGLDLVICVDLTTFAAAFLALLFLIRIPEISGEASGERESFLEAAKSGISWLAGHRLILLLILFLAGINLVASAFDAVLPAFILSSEKGGRGVLGLVTSSAGAATLVGSLIVTVLPAPKNRIRVIHLTMLFSLSTENFLLALSDDPRLWCFGQVIGWLLVPLMNANLDVVLRLTIPARMQGRVYSCRNTLQFFTIPVGYFLGGYMVDEVCGPVMNQAAGDSLLRGMFGSGEEAGAAMVLFILGIAGSLFCLCFGKILNKYSFPGQPDEAEK